MYGLGYALAMKRLLCLLPFLMFTTIVITAQIDPPLEGPLVATTPAREDRIILHDLSTGVVRELSFGVGEHQVWDFSPDGCRILFTVDAERKGMPRIYTANLDGSDVRDMVDFEELAPGDWGVMEPDWSPNGERIAFTMIRNQPTNRGDVEQMTHIAWVARDGGEPQFYSVTGREFTPQWSPDSEWLAYVSYDERVPGVDVSSTAVPTVEPPPGQTPEELPTILEADMWTVSADGETKNRLTAFATGNVRAPRWSPDGELIGFIYSPSANNDMSWMIANERGAIATQLSQLWNLTLDQTWLPDSSAMLASVRDFRGADGNRLWRIPLIGVADNDATLLLDDNAFRYTDYPRFSPDGQFLAFRSEYDVIILELDTGVWERLDEDTPGNTPPVWSPVGFEGEEACA
jgi:Tol biopolymer transport system component